MEKNIDKPIHKSKKATIFAISLIVAIVMQYLGKFNGEFPEYLKWVTNGAVFAQMGHDIFKAKASNNG